MYMQVNVVYCLAISLDRTHGQTMEICQDGMAFRNCRIYHMTENNFFL